MDNIPNLGKKGRQGGADYQTPRVIFVQGEIDEYITKMIMKDILRFEQENPTLDILMYVDSYGGSVDSFLAIYDAMQMCRCPIATLAIGKSMSCGQLIAMSGTKGKRFITKHGRLLMHPLSLGTYGTIHSVENDAAEGRRMQGQVEDIIIESSKLKRANVLELMKIDSYITPVQAVKYGLVDHIVLKPNDLYGRIKIAN